MQELRLPTLLTLALAALLALPDPAAAEERNDTGSFDLQIRGLRAGVLGFSGVRNETSYAATARLESAGLVGLIRKLRFDVSVRGRVTGDGLAPVSYSEDSDNGRRESRTVMEFRDGVPVVLVNEPERRPRDHDIDPASQQGTVDPMTAIYALFRDVPPEEACRMNLHLFDGRRRTQVTLGEPRQRDDRITCTGEMRRIAGYSPKEMAEHTRFPFEVVYGPAPDGQVRLVELTAESTHGRARLIRQ